MHSLLPTVQASPAVFGAVHVPLHESARLPRARVREWRALQDFALPSASIMAGCLRTLRNAIAKSDLPGSILCHGDAPLG